MVLVVVFQYPEVLTGAQLDADGYMRLVRVEQLVESWAWFDDRISRNNWPYADVLHWTRPLDVLIVGLALPLMPFLGTSTALHAAGSLISPLLHLAACLALVWAAAPVVSDRVRALAAPALLVQPVFLNFGLPGRADHHALIGLLFVVALGTALRWMAPAPGPAPSDLAALRQRPRRAFVTGILCGVGIWVSPEFLLPLALFLVAGGLLWVRDGASPQKAALEVNLGLLMGLVAALAAAILLERPPRAWFEAEYDRISIVHLTMALVGLGFWLTVVGLSKGRGRRDAPADGAGRRALAGAGGAAVAAGILWIIHPGFFRGPWIAAAPDVQELWLQHVQELQPMMPGGLAGLLEGEWTGVGRAVASVGAAVLVVPFAARRAWTLRPRGGSVVWGVLGGAALFFASLTFLQLRWGIYAGVLLALGVAALLDSALLRTERMRPGLGRRLARLGLMVALLPGVLFLGYGLEGALVAEEDESAGAYATERSCPIAEVVPLLRDPELTGGRPVTVLAHVDRGPELLFRTPHRVLAGPYHRNRRGLRDLHVAFTSEDLSPVRRILEEREVELILLCPEADRSMLGRGPPGSLFHRLVDGPAPSWAVELEVPDAAAGRLRLFRVRQ